MAKKSNGTDTKHVDDAPTEDAAAEGANCTDEVKREWYRDALIAKIAAESAQALAKTKVADFRNILKDAKKAGVDPAATTSTLKKRFQDEEDLILQYREELKMLDLSGKIPNIVDKLLARLNVQEPTASERAQVAIDRAYDEGVFDGRGGAMRDTNQFNPGTDLYDAWDRGWNYGHDWITGQAAIAAEMMPPAAVQ